MLLWIQPYNMLVLILLGESGLKIYEASMLFPYERILTGLMVVCAVNILLY